MAENTPSVAIGKEVNMVKRVIAIGYNAQVMRDDDIAIGFEASADGPGALAIGSYACARGKGAFAFGPKAFANGNAAIDIRGVDFEDARRVGEMLRAYCETMRKSAVGESEQQ